MIYLELLYFEQGTSWNAILIAVRRFAPATARVEGGDGQDRHPRHDQLEGQAELFRAWSAHGVARPSLGCSWRQRLASLGRVGPTWGAHHPRPGAPSWSLEDQMRALSA